MSYSHLFLSERESKRNMKSCKLHCDRKKKNWVNPTRNVFSRITIMHKKCVGNRDHHFSILLCYFTHSLTLSFYIYLSVSLNISIIIVFQIADIQSQLDSKEAELEKEKEEKESLMGEIENLRKELEKSEEEVCISLKYIHSFKCITVLYHSFLSS